MSASINGGERPIYYFDTRCAFAKEENNTIEFRYLNVKQDILLNISNINIYHKFYQYNY